MGVCPTTETKLGFGVDSPTHSLLGFIKVLRGKATAPLALDVIAGRFDRISRVERSAAILLRNGYISESGNGYWAITLLGSATLYRAARSSNGSRAVFDQTWRAD